MLISYFLYKVQSYENGPKQTIFTLFIFINNITPHKILEVEHLKAVHLGFLFSSK